MCYPGLLDASPVGPDRQEAGRRGELTQLRGIRDRLDREYLRPLDVEALAHSIGLAPRTLIRRFEIAYGRSPYGYLVARRTGPTLSSYCRTSQEEEG